MPGRVTIIQGHPDPGSKRLCHALADAYAEGVAVAGHEVTRVEVARLDFPIRAALAMRIMMSASSGVSALCRCMQGEGA